MNVMNASPALLLASSQFEYFNDFINYATGTDGVTSLAADAGVTAPVSVTGGVGGQITMSSGTTDNNEVSVFTTVGVFKMADSKPIEFECLIQFAEANTSAANVFAGLSSIAGANQLVDDGAGPAAGTSQSTLGIYKVDGETVWRTVSQKATTQTVTKTTTTAGGSSFQRLRIVCSPVDGTNCKVTYYVDGVQLRDSVNNLPIEDTVAYSSAAAMKAGVYLKGGSTTSETLIADYIYAGQLR